MITAIVKKTQTLEYLKHKRLKTLNNSWAQYSKYQGQWLLFQGIKQSSGIW